MARQRSVHPTETTIFLQQALILIYSLLFLAWGTLFVFPMMFPTWKINIQRLPDTLLNAIQTPAGQSFTQNPPLLLPAETQRIQLETTSTAFIPTTKIISTYTPSAAIVSSMSVPNLANLQVYMLEIINSDRQTQGLNPLDLDPFASKVGQAHAEDMAQNNYLSHWNMIGYGPDIRFSLAGGTDFVMENIFSSWSRYDNGTPVPIEDWHVQIRQAEESFMNSPGHRANILTPEHTHVGIGIAYNPLKGEFRIAQEFTNHYIVLDSIQKEANPGETITIHGQLVSGSTNPLINLDYEPFPQPKTVKELNQTNTYTSPAQFFLNIPVQEEPNHRFGASIPLGNQSGLYHIRIWVNTPVGETPAIDAVIFIGKPVDFTM